jgi:hypothetical protein
LIAAAFKLTSSRSGSGSFSPMEGRASNERRKTKDTLQSGFLIVEGIQEAEASVEDLTERSFGIEEEKDDD